MTKKYYVKTDYVPDDCDYLTAGKEYEFELEGDDAGYIQDDDGCVTTIHLKTCAYLKGNPWILIEKEGKK